MIISDCIVIGASRGLGAALISRIMDSTSCRVYGVSRTPIEDIPEGAVWTSTGRYSHLQLDIAGDHAVGRLSGMTAGFSGSICVIFNAAHIEKDFTRGGNIDIGAFDRVNRVGITGLRNTLESFEGHLLKHGGIFAGVSSVWGRFTPISLSYVSYPASKAYLDSCLRSLRHLWPAQVRITAVTIGNIKKGSGSLPAWFIPTYEMAAKKIVSRLFSGYPPRHIEYPKWHVAVYKYVLRWVPDRLVKIIFSMYLGLESRSGIPPHSAKNGKKKELR